ncbi:hypothetical protein LguiB_004775 [Lonicera macranthoides]
MIGSHFRNSATKGTEALALSKLIKAGFWMNPRVPEVAVKPELENLINTYGKFWCTWQLDRDRVWRGFDQYQARLVVAIASLESDKNEAVRD